ncbi:MAG: DUF3365 domain-containing protein [Proteobacteria bacterium]|nr:DUF3365 domain-containing protein [Pseudomonadota bacterium]MBU1717216.1 DUF3365 domain-containing protein [Pseudomonadota bacterium]
MGIREKMGIRSKFVIMMGSFGVLALIAIGFGAYQFSIKGAMSEAEGKGNLIFNYIMSSRNYFNEYQRPLIMELVEKERFYPELMSGFVITRGTWDMISKELEGYQFKQASFDPLFAGNKANLDEEKIINQFRADANLTKLEGRIVKEGAEYFYMAKPIAIESIKCLRCHGDPKQAPKDQVEIYGSEHGYNWKVGDVVSAYVVYVPLSKAIDSARKSAVVLFVGGSAAMLLALLGIWLFLDWRIVKPIMKLSEMTQEVSVGKNLERGLASSMMKDEIGELAKSVDRLRISMVKMLKRRKND